MVHNIPEIVRSKDSLRLKFFQSEDNLLAMGLAQFHRNYRLIAEHMLPAKTPKQLKIRSKNLNSKREPSNPVKCLKRTGALQLVETRVAVHEPRGKHLILRKFSMECHQRQNSNCPVLMLNMEL